MKLYTVDFTGVKTYWQFYEALMKGLGLPEWFGKNAGALWDMLTGYIEYHAMICLYGVNKLPQDFISVRDLVIEIFQEVSIYYIDKRFEIKIMS